MAALLVLTSMTTGDDKPSSPAKQYEAFGVAFYNLENLFDTINATAPTTKNSRHKAPANGTRRNTTKNSTTWHTPSAKWQPTPPPTARL